MCAHLAAGWARCSGSASSAGHSPAGRLALGLCRPAGEGQELISETDRKRAKSERPASDLSIGRAAPVWPQSVCNGQTLSLLCGSTQVCVCVRLCCTVLAARDCVRLRIGATLCLCLCAALSLSLYDCHALVCRQENRAPLSSGCQVASDVSWC